MLEGTNAISAPEVSVASDGKGLSGWLEKQADWKLKWNKRLITIKGRTISYREQENVADKNCARLQALQKNTGQERCMRLWTERGECWLLRAPTTAVHKEWTDYMADVLMESERQEAAAASGAANGSSFPNVIKGTVLKKAHWTGQWRSRYIVVDGVELRYAEKEGGSDRKRYVLTSVERCANETELRVEASDGEFFHMRLDSQKEADAWYATLRHSLDIAQSERWQTVVVEGDRNTKALLGTSYHCSALVDPQHMLVFGGVSSTLPTNMGKATCSNEVVCMSLLGAHPCEAMNVKPFEESAGAKTKPAPREGAASAALHDGTWYIHGGLNTESQAVLSDLWCIRLGENNSKQMVWERVFKPSSCPMPGLYGHSLTPVRMSKQNGDGDQEVLLLIGGASKNANVAEKSIQVVNLAKNLSGCVSTERVLTMEKELDLPRARHTAVALPNVGDNAANVQHIVLLGGCGAKNDSSGMSEVSMVSYDGANNTVSVSTLDVSPPLPKMIAPGAAARLSGDQQTIDVFIVGGNGEGLPQVYNLSFNTRDLRRSSAPSVSSSSTVSVTSKRVDCLGDTPSMHFGMSCFIKENFLYAIGDHAVAPIGPGVKRCVLPVDPTSVHYHQKRPNSVSTRLDSDGVLANGALNAVSTTALASETAYVASREDTTDFSHEI